MTIGAFRTATSLLAALLVVAAVVTVRVSVSGRADLRTAEACRDAGFPSTAVDFAARASRWYLPVGGVSRSARELLRTLAMEAQAAGRPELSLRAWQELRGAVRSTRWLTTPDADLLEESDAAIARGMAAIDRLPDGRPGLDAAGHLAFLRRETLPRTAPAAATVLLFIGWVAVTAAGAWRALTPEGRLNGRSAWGWGLASATLLAGWLVCLSLA